MKQMSFEGHIEEANERDDLFRKITKHIGEYFEQDVSYLKIDSRLSSTIPGIDSMKLFEMILYLEDCFGVTFDESVMENIEILGELTDHIMNLRLNKNEATAGI